MTDEAKRTNPGEVFRTEAEAEAAQRALVDQSREQLGDRCPSCDALGSLEEIDGAIKCIDCDETVLRGAKLGGLGKK